MMTLAEFQQLPPGEAFASGEAFQHARLVRWIAVKGWGDDWAVYVGPYTHGLDEIRARGDKVFLPATIQQLVPCEPDVLRRYRL